MIPEYTYTEFKRKLYTNPKWIIRGLIVLAYCPDIATPKNIREIEECLRAIQENGGELPLGYGRMSDIVCQHAPDIYRFYRKQFEVPRMGTP